MMKKENPHSKMRCKLLDICSEKNLSYHTIAIITKCMEGKPDNEKERFAEMLIEIILTSNSEEEILNKANEIK